MKKDDNYSVLRSVLKNLLWSSECISPKKVLQYRPKYRVIIIFFHLEQSDKIIYSFEDYLVWNVFRTELVNLDF